MTSNTEWKAYSNYEYIIPRINVKLTEDIYDPFYEYFFTEDTENTLESS